MIYFIQPKAGGPIKIGTSIRLSQRLAQLRSDFKDDLKILAVTDGGHAQESQLHWMFRHLRKFGEWFEPGDDLLGFIIQECRQWDGQDDVPKCSNIKISDDLSRIMDVIIALRRKRGSSTEGGQPLDKSTYLDSLIRTDVEKDYENEIQLLNLLENQ